MHPEKPLRSAASIGLGPAALERCRQFDQRRIAPPFQNRHSWFTACSIKPIYGSCRKGNIKYKFVQVRKLKSELAKLRDENLQSRTKTGLEWAMLLWSWIYVIAATWIAVASRSPPEFKLCHRSKLYEKRCLFQSGIQSLGEFYVASSLQIVSITSQLFFESENWVSVASSPQQIYFLLLIIPKASQKQNQGRRRSSPHAQRKLTYLRACKILQEDNSF